MSYYYEALNHISFQKFAQSLIVSVHPETICLPVQQPDGGRDALLYHTVLERNNFVVFQIKFSTKPKETSEREAIAKLIKSEEGKVASLIQQGATHYYLVTNVQGTAHPDTGSIDKINKKLTEQFQIPCFVWWRDDLDARLDNASDVKWSYPQICRGSDVLQLLIKRPENTTELEAARAITAYMGKQYGADRDVKFKQVELKRQITDLFVDIPIGHKGPPREGRRVQQIPSADGMINRYLEGLNEYVEFETEEGHLSTQKELAARFLLHMPFGKGVSRLVLEGAPGQGKSTVTQFLCQVNRLKILSSYPTELDSLDSVYKAAPTRAPFRIDIRDYAAWVAGRHPYAGAKEVILPEEGQRSLESFLTMQVSWYSGGLNITQHDLLDFFVRAHSVIILDGFDEIADIDTRVRVVGKICAAADRLHTHAQSLQIIVTSRPAAFANSPGFPEEDWIHLQLNDLKRPNITAYKEKWAKAQDLTNTEKESLTATLEEKLQQPHLRDLSRNPMQLAILLQLMHVQGAALPDKRTALYDEYMKIFLNREVEKKQIAGDHRELILSIHGLLAWILQTQAETGQGSGSITKKELTSEVSIYLKNEEHDLTLVSSLLKGTVERVGALVSRVQGTFEFEVQPLREYFAARHLYKTAPYSPPRRARQGTKPDRFAALASSSYWTNVTRFFCGFYDVGELPSLVDELIEISEKDGYRLISQPRRLMLMLLSDYVFTQSPKYIRKLISFIAKQPDLERLLSAGFEHNQREMALPTTAGGTVLFETCVQMLQSETNPELRKALRQVIARNGDRSKVKKLCFSGGHNGVGTAGRLEEIQDFGLLNVLTLEEIALVVGKDMDMHVRLLADANMHEEILNDPDLYKLAREKFLNFEMFFPVQRPFHTVPSNSLLVLSELLFSHLLEYFTIQPEYIVEFERLDFLRQDFLKRDGERASASTMDPFEKFVQFVVELMNEPSKTWRSDLSPWEQLVDRGYLEAPNGRLFSIISMLSTAVSSVWEKSEEQGGKVNLAISLIEDALIEDAAQAAWDDQGFSTTPGLVRRLFFAKTKGGDLSWWRARLLDTEGDGNVLLVAALVCWGSGGVISELCGELSELLNALAEDEWLWFLHMTSLTISVAGPQIDELSDEWFVQNGGLSERLALALTRRLSDGSDRRMVARKCFREYKGGDGQVLQTAAEWELLSEPYDDIDWEFAKYLSMQARSGRVEYLFSPSHAMHRVAVPEEVAKQVLEECNTHNWQFISLCERSLSSCVAQGAKKVATISEEEKWFEDEASY